MVRDFMINLMSQVGQLTIFSRHVCTKDGTFLGTYTISNVKQSMNLEIQFSNLNICGSSYGENTSHTYQGCISCGTCSYLELTEDHVLTSAYVKFLRTVMRNAVNKSV